MLSDESFQGRGIHDLCDKFGEVVLLEPIEQLAFHPGSCGAVSLGRQLDLTAVRQIDGAEAIFGQLLGDDLDCDCVKRLGDLGGLSFQGGLFFLKSCDFVGQFVKNLH